MSSFALLRMIQTELGSMGFQKGQRFMVSRADIDYLKTHRPRLFGAKVWFRVCNQTTFISFTQPQAMLRRHACLASSSSSSPRFIFSKQPRLLDNFSRRLPKHDSTAFHTSHLVSISRTVDLANNPPHSDLGLRSHRPPDSLPDHRPETPPEVPDQEWEIRTGGRVQLNRQSDLNSETTRL